MAQRNDAQEMSRSADRITEAVQELTRSVDRLAEIEVRRSVPASDEEVARVADEATRRVRRQIAEEENDLPRRPALTSAEIEAWERRRDERRRREGYPGYAAS